MAIPQSKTWKATQYREEEIFNRKRIMAVHYCIKSPFHFQTYKDWLMHQITTREARVKREKQRTESRAAHKKTQVHDLKAFPEKGVFQDNRSAVLWQFTIWCQQPEHPLRALARWPSKEEFKYEGDDRAHAEDEKANLRKGDKAKKEGTKKKRPHYGRFLPLPRECKEDDHSWKAGKVLTPLSALDARSVPKAADCLDALHAGDFREKLFWAPIHGSMEAFVKQIEDDILNRGCP